MATIKAIEGRSVHQIQSGQVIVDLCSVVKELVENSLDAGATSLDVRFKNHGLEAIEVQDNGGGIAPEDYDTIALKHYTSKLSSYDDLDSLQTFGFRGEALSSLCALSKFHIATARASDGPKGTRLDFEISGKLKNTSVVASQKGTTVVVESIFNNLPVRRRELEKNIKREYGKVLGLLHAYACISTGVRFAVSNQASKTKKIAVFSTKANPTTRENIANVYGAKTLVALVPMELRLEMQPATYSTQNARNWSTQQDDRDSRAVHVLGHISRPVVGEGRQTPDRQMFFVNSRPCGLPQVAKAFNEVYKSYNVSQSPFIFANLKMDTSAYDVNVSPDKRTILLHDQTALLESLKAELVKLFEKHDQSVPQAQVLARKLPVFKQLTMDRDAVVAVSRKVEDEGVEVSEVTASSSTEVTGSFNQGGRPNGLIHKFVSRDTNERTEISPVNRQAAKPQNEVTSKEKEKEKLVRFLKTNSEQVQEASVDSDEETTESLPQVKPLPRPVQDFNDRIASQQAKRAAESGPRPIEPELEEEPIPSVTPSPQKSAPGPVINAFDRMRPKRTPADTAMITIGDYTTNVTIGTPVSKKRRIHTPQFGPGGTTSKSPLFGRGLRAFVAPGTQAEEDGSEEERGSDDEDVSQISEVVEPAEVARSSASSRDSEVSSDGAAADQQDELELEASKPESPLFMQDEQASDDEYIDEAEEKAREEARVAQLIEEAEEAAARPTHDNLKRASTLLKSRPRKDSTLQLVRYLDTTVARIEQSLARLTNALEAHSPTENAAGCSTADAAADESPEERLSLNISKADFARMRIIGQFNLGFILASRPSDTTDDPSSQSNARSKSDELFIIDQHASDEKYNFERLQAETVVQNQRLVRPRVLSLTAIEEEIILEHPAALAKNGFQVEIDTSGDSVVGQRCRLVSLPMSREVVFDVADLEELIALLGESGGVGNEVPRPGKVRRMFAMRACRSSIMVGKTLTKAQMERVVRNLGGLDKPWNCPHGRPTMRHLAPLDGWEGWSEGMGVVGLGEREQRTDWRGYVKSRRPQEDERSGEDETMEDVGEVADDGIAYALGLFRAPAG